MARKLKNPKRVRIKCSYELAGKHDFWIHNYETDLDLKEGDKVIVPTTFCLVTDLGAF